MIDPQLMKLRVRDNLSVEEEAALRAMVTEVRDFPADKVIVRAGDLLDTCMLLISGLMRRFKDLPNGQRQVTELHVAGDFADLHSFTLKRLDHNVGTLTACKVAIVPHDRLREITEQHPHLARMLWFSTNLDAAIHREWEVSLGRRSALERLAHLFCEMDCRLEIVDLAHEGRYDLALTQEELAECLGITPVHVNRTMQQLRELGLVEFRGGKVTIHDREELRRRALFDPAYLYLECLPR
jgi:CRP-like cAMP-binding protein